MKMNKVMIVAMIAVSFLAPRVMKGVDASEEQKMDDAIAKVFKDAKIDSNQNLAVGLVAAFLFYEIMRSELMIECGKYLDQKNEQAYNDCMNKPVDPKYHPQYHPSALATYYAGVGSNANQKFFLDYYGDFSKRMYLPSDGYVTYYAKMFDANKNLYKKLIDACEKNQMKPYLVNNVTSGMRDITYENFKCIFNEVKAGKKIYEQFKNSSCWCKLDKRCL